MNAPPSLYRDSAGPAQPFEVRTGSETPTEADVDENFQVVLVTRSAGGHRLDHCELIYSLGDAGKHLQDTGTTAGMGGLVQVHLVDPNSDESAGCVFSGELGISAIQIGKSRESLQYTARIEPYYFGDPLLGPQVLDVDGETILTPNVPIVFQPLIDGRIEDNMLVTVTSPTADFDGYALWVDPESVRTTPAKNAKSQVPVPWTLAHAVHSLCWACNPEELFITNPELAELQTIFEQPDDEEGDVVVDEAAAESDQESDEESAPGEADALPPAEVEIEAENQSPQLRNVELSRGKRLPQLLDELLPRFGFNWFVEPVLEETNDAGEELDEAIVKNTIRVFRLGDGNKTRLYLQRQTNPPSAVLAGKSNVPELAVEWNWADLANQITGQGSLLEWEATFELYRGWTEDQDALDADELRMLDDAATISDDESQFKRYPNAWRRWVLNEAGDYCSTRTVVAPIPDLPFDLKPLLGDNTQAKRRKFLHCLTKDHTNERREVFAEWRDPTVVDETDPEAWKAIPHNGVDVWEHGGFHVLQKECGIYFSGSTPPKQLIDLGDDARIRVTACLRGDDRLSYTAERLPETPNANTVVLFVDLSDRFHQRDILLEDLPGESGYPTIYKSSLLAETYGDDTIDDTRLLTEYCESLRTIEQAARLSCEFEVAGIQTGYQIGDLVVSVDGRNISLNRNSPKQGDKLYPQITAITYDRAKQRTKLRVETFDFSKSQTRKLQL